MSASDPTPGAQRLAARYATDRSLTGNEREQLRQELIRQISIDDRALGSRPAPGIGAPEIGVEPR
jgi:hypothetical protein